MRKVLFTMVAAAFIFAGTTNEASAQIGVQAGIALPMGDWGDIWGMGFGGQVSYKKESGDGMKIGGSVGYFSLPGDEIDLGGFGTFEYGNITMIPILGTFDYALNESIYVGADAGYNVISLDGGGPGAAGSSAALIPKAGFKMGALSIEARYNVIGDSYLSALVGYSFGE